MKRPAKRNGEWPRALDANVLEKSNCVCIRWRVQEKDTIELKAKIPAFVRMNRVSHCLSSSELIVSSRWRINGRIISRKIKEKISKNKCNAVEESEKEREREKDVEREEREGEGRKHPNRTKTKNYLNYIFMIQCRIRVHYIHVSHRLVVPDVVSATIHRITIIGTRTTVAVRVTVHHIAEQVDDSRHRYVVAAVTVRKNVWDHPAGHRWKSFALRPKAVAVVAIAIHATHRLQLVAAWKKRKSHRPQIDRLSFADDWCCDNETALVVWNLPAWGGMIHVFPFYCLFSNTN